MKAVVRTLSSGQVEEVEESSIWDGVCLESWRGVDLNPVILVDKHFKTKNSSDYFIARKSCSLEKP